MRWQGVGGEAILSDGVEESQWRGPWSVSRDSCKELDSPDKVPDRAGAGVTSRLLPRGSRMCGKHRTWKGAFSNLWQWLDLQANFRKCGKERS